MVQHGIIVQGCNAQGKMNSGLAKEVRALYPGAFKVYEQEFQQKGLFLGGVTYYHPASVTLAAKVVIANAITQLYYGRDKDIVYVDYPALFRCFADVAKTARSLNLPVHFPLIGCGLANGNWARVLPRIEAALGPDIEKTLWIF